MTWLPVSVSLHWSENDVHGIDFFEFTRADYAVVRYLLLLHAWHSMTDFSTFQGAVTISDRTD